MKVISPLLGFNNNVKHKGRVFHVQTEDSGVRHPHVITHLFADGGRILKTMKTSYAQHLNEGNLRDIVHQLMKEQHKAMFVALRDGQFDHFFEEKDAAAKEAQSAGVPSSGKPLAPASVAVPPSSIAAPVSAVSPVSIASAPVASGLRPTAPDSLSAPQSSGIELDFRTLSEQAAAPAPEVQVPPDLAAAPASIKQGGALFTAGVYRTLSGPTASAAGGAAGSGRYAHARPASVFGSAKPAQNVSIFGEDLISEKSLDEVILSYLAEDLESE